MSKLAVVAISLGLFALPATAERPRCRVEMVSLADNLIRTLGTQVDLQGHLIRDARFELELDGGHSARPIERRALLRGEVKLRFVLLLESSVAYAPATEAVREAVHAFLSALPQDSTGEVWRFGNRVDVPLGLQPLPTLLALVDRYSATDEGELQLTKAVRQGLHELGEQAEPGTRRVLVVLADGLNSVMDKQLFRELGQELAQQGVPLFPVAFSPRDIRGPLRNLGELARHGAGTLRWAQRTADLTPQFVALANELVSAEVLTFPATKLAMSSSQTAALRLKCGEGHSNVALMAIPRHRWWWLVLGGAGALAVLVVVMLLRRGSPEPAKSEEQQPMLLGRGGSLRGKQLRLGNTLAIGVGLSGPGTWSLGPGPEELRCEIRQEGLVYALNARDRSARVFINGNLLLGSVVLNDGDRVQIGDLAEFAFCTSAIGLRKPLPAKKEDA